MPSYKSGAESLIFLPSTEFLIILTLAKVE
uniref:Uncharacterized protein n=1 Tax=Arundo donax TaxID=35708 RepID=A0A0A9A873_ARUDO